MSEHKTCETCRFIDEETTPCTCKRGKGKVAYQRPACEEHKERKQK